jgi:hypothetical protein
MVAHRRRDGARPHTHTPLGIFLIGRAHVTMKRGSQPAHIMTLSGARRAFIWFTHACLHRRA